MKSHFKIRGIIIGVIIIISAIIVFFTFKIPNTTSNTDNQTNGTSNTGQIPSHSETTLMVQKTMELFSNAINKGDFTNFYSNISKFRQKETTAAELQKSFQAFIDHKVDLSFTSTTEPTYTAIPTIDSNGILTIQGTFTTKDSTVTFEQKFIKENDEWMLFGINVQVD